MGMGDKDYYQVLGVQESADPQQIKEAYRKLAFKYHPDRNQKQPETAESMKAVNEAYAVLSNPDKRSEYDRLRRRFGPSAPHRFRNSFTEQEIFSNTDVHQVFEEMSRAFGLRGFEDIFKNLYGTNYKSFEFSRPGFTARGFVFFGTFHPFGMGRTQLPLTSALGKLSRYLLKQIGGAQGPAENGADICETIELDSSLARDGGPYAFFHKQQSKKLVVRIPPGIREGQKIRLSKMGEKAKGGGSPGDLLLKVRIQKPVLQRLRDLIGHRGH